MVERRLHHQVADAGGVAGTDRGAAVDDQVEVDAVVPEQHRLRRGGIALVAGELGGVLQAADAAVLQAHLQRAIHHGVAGRVMVRAGGQRRGLVQKSRAKAITLAPRTGL